ncbi:hypothetical protein L226DRAFT_540029 [Lentinus tigrinus ALCF2SS1-7]|nr:hypothetical protein L226DRAFT_540029 [Lentinus tigrinus ALCF2SS1-7]
MAPSLAPRAVLRPASQASGPATLLAPMLSPSCSRTSTTTAPATVFSLPPSSLPSLYVFALSGTDHPSYAGHSPGTSSPPKPELKTPFSAGPQREKRTVCKRPQRSVPRTCMRLFVLHPCCPRLPRNVCAAAPCYDTAAPVLRLASARLQSGLQPPGHRRTHANVSSSQSSNSVFFVSSESFHFHCAASHRPVHTTPRGLAANPDGSSRLGLGLGLLRPAPSSRRRSPVASELFPLPNSFAPSFLC